MSLSFQKRLNTWQIRLELLLICLLGTETRQMPGWIDFCKQFVPSLDYLLKEKKILSWKALLNLGNASWQPDPEQLWDEESKVVFLPPNVTSLCQPLDQGILVTVNKIYRSKFPLSLVLDMDGGHEMLGLDVVGWIAEFWDDLEPSWWVRKWVPIKQRRKRKIQIWWKRIPSCEEATDGDGWGRMKTVKL